MNPTPIHAPLNDNGEASSDGVPSNHADLSFEYADSDSTSGSFQSSLDITVPASVDDFQDYVAYWGESDSTIHQGSSSPIGEVAKESASAGSIALPITLRSIPVSPSAPTHILVFVRQGLNLNSIPISAPLKDNGVGSSGGEPSDHTDLYFKYTDQNSGTGLFLGSFQIREPADISDFERYVFYLGSSETTIHPESSSPIVTKSKLSSSGTINFVMDLALDFSSFAVSPTHLLAYVRQGLNLNPTAIVAPFVDNRGGSSDGVPVDHSDLGFEYSDTNGADGVFESNLVISVPATDSDFQEYVAYWGESSSVVHSASSDVIGSIDKSFASAGSISLSIASSSIPASPTTTHILVFLRNGLNLNPTPVAAPLNDNGVGSSGGIPDDHSDLYFTYEDIEGTSGTFIGAFKITEPSALDDFDSYVAYWGESATTIHSGSPGAILTASKVASLNTIEINTETFGIPSSPSTPTHILIFVRQGLNLNLNPIAAPFVDNRGGSSDPIPSDPADLSFEYSDQNSVALILQLSITLTQPSDISDFDEYVIYYGESETEIHSASSSALGTINTATGVSTLPTTAFADVDIPTSPTATHILVFVRKGLNLNPTPIHAPLKDNGVGSSGGVPDDHSDLSFAYTDNDGGNGIFLGSFQIQVPSVTSDFDEYVFYWGDSEFSVHSTDANSFTSVSNSAAVNGRVTFVMPASVSTPSSGASHILVFLRKGLNLNSIPVAAEFSDNGAGGGGGTDIPVNRRDLSFSFTDSDATGNSVQGTFSISEPTIIEGFNDYVLFWGESEIAIHSSATAPFASISKSTAGSTLNLIMAAGVSIPATPASATHILLYMRSGSLLNTLPASAAIVDNGYSFSSPLDHDDMAFSFTDSDSALNVIQGTVEIIEPSSVDDFDSYVLFWGSSSTQRLDSTTASSFAEITKVSASSTITYEIPSGTAVPTSPSSPTHILLHVRKGQFINPTPVFAVFNDNSASFSSPTNHEDLGFSFADSNGGNGVVSGTFTISEPSDVSDFDSYVVYWGQSATLRHQESTTPFGEALSDGTGGGTMTFDVTGTITVPTSPATATHILVYVRSGAFINPIPINALFVDNGNSLSGPSNHGDLSFSITDTVQTFGSIQGTITIDQPSDLSDFDEYVVYWGETATSIHSGATSPFAVISKVSTGIDIIFNMPAAVTVPHLILPHCMPCYLYDLGQQPILFPLVERLLMIVHIVSHMKTLITAKDLCE